MTWTSAQKREMLKITNEIWRGSNHDVSQKTKPESVEAARLQKVNVC